MIRQLFSTFLVIFIQFTIIYSLNNPYRMKQKKMLSLSLSQLKQAYRQELPEIVALAIAGESVASFRQRLEEHLDMYDEHEASKQIRAFIQFDGREVYELSTETNIQIQTLTLLWQFLTGATHDQEVTRDLLIDLFYQFKRLKGPLAEKPNLQKLKSRTEKWPTGLDENIIRLREENKERMIRLLVAKIESRKTVAPSRFQFPPDATPEDKYQLVGQWWNDYRFHLSMAIKSPAELNRFLNNSLSEETLRVLMQAKKKNIPFFVTPYYLSLLDTTGSGYNDETIRSYILYSPELVDTYGDIRAWEKEDIVEAGKPNAAGWLLPNAHNIHRRYPEVAILIPDTMGRACGGLCASCQRMYDFQSERLNFELESLAPKETWDKKLRRLMTYFEEDTQLRDILITGGDALMSQNKTLHNILDAVYKMAIRKQKANWGRPEGEKYAELQRVRLGTRLPVYLPMRINDELIGILKAFKDKASAVGVKQFVIQTHFQSPLEVTPEARDAIKQIISAGWIITNQLVYTVAASRRGHTTRLRQVLNSLGVVCYYTFSVKGFHENYAVFTPNSRSIQEEKEEKAVGRLTLPQQEELVYLLEQGTDTDERIRKFMKKHRLPFLATDRNVLNLPGIGKSMTFTTVGITPQGQRILWFDHDATRRHSPIINQMGKIFIVENKSVAAYLRQLEKLGEDAEEYNTIWEYTEGKTEPRFRVFEYPLFRFRTTDRISNLEV